MDRMAAVRLGNRELVAPAGEGVSAVTDPVGPRHQQLTTSTRAANLTRVSGQDVTTAKGIGAQATPHLDHDSFVVTTSDGPLLAAGQNAHIRTIRRVRLAARRNTRMGRGRHDRDGHLVGGASQDESLPTFDGGCHHRIGRGGAAVGAHEAVRALEGDRGGTHRGDLATLEHQRLGRAVDGRGHVAVQSRSTQETAKPTEPLGPITPHTRPTGHTGLQGVVSVLSALTAAVTLAKLVTLITGEAVLSLPHHVEAIVVTQHHEACNADAEQHQTDKSARGYADRPTPAAGGGCLVHTFVLDASGGVAAGALAAAG